RHPIHGVPREPTAPSLGRISAASTHAREKRRAEAKAKAAHRPLFAVAVAVALELLFLLRGLAAP
ncbi:hypothetical protein JY408_10565, partial [Stenotrophomonas maltophilia]|nr:hypothetical protein [Stenotrophomonas maltophilia]